MKGKLLILPFLIFLFSCTSQDKISHTDLNVIRFAAIQFPLNEVKLLDGPFSHAMELDMKTLLTYEPDRLLSRFFTEAGLKPRAEHYMGWENETLAGHSLGHYLSACSMMYESTGDARFLERVNYIAGQLKIAQDSSGYLGAFPTGKMIFEEQVAKGNIRSSGFDLNGIWSPFYTVHKILAGLRDAYRSCGNTDALLIEKKFAGWIEKIVMPLNDEQTQLMLRCEHGGIAETLADLYSDTGDKEYLQLADKFYHKAVLDSLKLMKDILPRKHCNTNIPKLIGLSRIYELTGDTTARKAAIFFWNTVVSHHSYVTGGNGNKEYFGPEDRFSDRLGPETTESCNVYNMLKLSEHLFEWEPSAKVADFYERALFNHILPSQDPATGRVTYNLSLAIGGYKDFQDPYDFTCCIGTGMENHSKYGRNIYYHNDKDLYVFQYIASQLDWKEKGITLIQKTHYPEEQGTEFEFLCKSPEKINLLLRYPGWAENGIHIKINDVTFPVEANPGSYISILRKWKNGDRVSVSIPFSLRMLPMADNKNRVAFMYGPVVLAGEMGSIKPEPAADTSGAVLMTNGENVDQIMKKVEGKNNTFLAKRASGDIFFEPFYIISDRRYSVYWDLN